MWAINFIMQYENTIPKRKNLRKFIWCTRGMRWSRLFCITLTLVSLAKSYASLISCIGSLASGRSVGFWHGSGIPAQQEDIAEDMMHAGEGVAPKEGVPEVRGDRSTCEGRLIRVSNVRGAKMRSCSEDVAARARQRG